MDASAFVKRYLREAGSDVATAALESHAEWVCSRLGFAETLRAIGRKAGLQGEQAERFRAEWEAVSVVELDRLIAEDAARLSASEDLRTLDGIHLASALRLGVTRTVFATWDRRLHDAAARHGFAVLPEAL